MKKIYFTVRVELHNEGSEKYDQLHDQMKIAGFKRTVMSSARVKRNLPTAEYSKIQQIDISDLSENDAVGVAMHTISYAVKDAAQKSEIKKENLSILITASPYPRLFFKLK